MNSDKVPRIKLVGATVTVKPQQKRPAYFTARHDTWVGKTGRVHAVIAGAAREDPLLKVGFAPGRQIVFFQLSDLHVHADETLVNPPRHGKRGSHLP